ncbi:MAG: acireductone synthase [Oligoflexus sp.]
MNYYILTDIEGTTTDIDFVHTTLFPYSLERIAEFVTRHHKSQPEIQSALELVEKTLNEESKISSPELKDCIKALETWIREDRKHPGLKLIQGHIWKSGYMDGDFQGHVYDDVRPMLEKWRESGYHLGVYSSGSVQAQKLLFSHSSAGDLTSLFAAYFDTAIGHKRETKSYKNIALNLQVSDPKQVIFLSDIEEELAAAEQAGMNTILLDRNGLSEAASNRFIAKDFYGVDQLISQVIWPHTD